MRAAKVLITIVTIFKLEHSPAPYDIPLKANISDFLKHFFLFQPWCSTQVDDDGSHVGGQGKWGNCGPGCPIPEDPRSPDGNLPPGRIIIKSFIYIYPKVDIV